MHILIIVLLRLWEWMVVLIDLLSHCLLLNGLVWIRFVLFALKWLIWVVCSNIGKFHLIVRVNWLISYLAPIIVIYWHIIYHIIMIIQYICLAIVNDILLSWINSPKCYIRSWRRFLPPFEVYFYVAELLILVHISKLVLWMVWMYV